MALTYRPNDIRWWLAREEGFPGEPHDHAFRWIDCQRSDTQRRREQAKRNAQLMDCDLSPFGIGSSTTVTTEDVPRQNIILNAADTIAAKWSNQRIVPMAVTEGATYDEQQRAEEFNRGIDALFDLCGVYANDHLWCQDALAYSAAVAKVTMRNGEPLVERIFEWELFVDPREAARGWRGVRSIGHLFPMDKLVFLAERGDGLSDEQRQRILDGTMSRDDASLFCLSEGTSDQVIVAELWHLPSGPEAKDGKYFLGTRDVTAKFDAYEREGFPLKALYEKKPSIGVWQRPMVTRQAPTQREHDKITQKLQDCHDLLGVPRLRVFNGARVNKSELDDEVGSIINVDGAPGSVEDWNAQPAHPDTYTYQSKLEAIPLRTEGVSEMAAQGLVPAGMRDASGKAIQAYVDEGSERLVPRFRLREEFYVGIGELLLDALRESGGKYVVQIVDGKRMRLVPFKDLDIGRDKYRLRVQPTSFLQHTPSAKYQQLAEMRERGDITPVEFRKLSGLPDLLAQNELDTAAQDIVDKTIAKILRDGTAMTVLPFDNHELILERGTKAVNLARVRDEDPTKLEHLIAYVQQAFDAIEAKKAKLAAAAAAAAPPPGLMPPPGGPMPPAGAPPPMPPPGPMPAPEAIPPEAA